MNKEHLYVAVAVVAALLIGYALHGPAARTQTGGDFAGGVVPGQLFTGNASGGPLGVGYVQPIGSLAISGVNGVSIGGTSLYNDQAVYATASSTPAAVTTLGPIGSTTSTATSSLTIQNSAGLAIGDICSGGAATTTIYVAGCTLTSTNGVTGTATYAYTNITGAAISIPTSTRFNVSFEHLPY